MEAEGIMKPQFRIRPQFIFGIEYDMHDLYLHIGPFQIWWMLP